MTRIERSAMIFYSTEQMFALVNDVESYPQFLPGCHDAKILSMKENSESGEGLMQAELDLGKFGLSQRFTTENRFKRSEFIRLQLLDGPFKHFQGEWVFETLKESACKLSFWLEFDFSSRIVAMAAGKVFEQVASEQVTAMCDRAKKIYS